MRNANMDKTTVGVSIREELNVNLTLIKRERTGSTDEHCQYYYKRASEYRNKRIK
jgi:hypothetical protein